MVQKLGFRYFVFRNGPGFSRVRRSAQLNMVWSIDGVTPVVDPSTFVHPTAVLIGDVVVGPECYIGPGASLRGDMGPIRVGAGCNIQDNCVLHGFPGGTCVVEDWGHIGHGAVVHGCRIGHNALVGMNAVVMDEADVGSSAFVGAMAFVKARFEVPARMLVTGVPAKIVRTLSEEELAWKSRGTEEYQQLARRSLATMQKTEALAEIPPERGVVDAPDYAPLHATKKG